MKQLSLGLFLLLAFTAFAFTAFAQQNGNGETAITVYNNDLGVVREVRKFDLSSGTSEVKLEDVPTRIDPTTVKITDLDHPNAVDVREQNYEYDLVSQAKLLSKYLDKTITVTDDKGVSTSGTLLAVEEDKLTLATNAGIEMLPNLSRYTMSVPQLASGLITKPTLIWQLQSDKSFSQEPLEVLYQTGGMSWHAEYIAALSADDKSLDLTGWVSIENNSGASFPNAKLKLVAGALHRVAPVYDRLGIGTERALTVAAKPQFDEHAMFEYHVYDLGRQTNLNNDEVKQISLLEANGVGATKRYTYEGGTSVGVTVSFENTQGSHLGMPLPAGTIRVMKRDKDGSMEFVGEDKIDHTPKDEKITLHVGNAFDLVGAHEVTDSHSLGEKANQESIAITLKNHKDEDVTIDAIEHLGSDWKITDHSMPYDKENADQIVFHVPVKANGTATVTYTVVHRW